MSTATTEEPTLVLEGALCYCDKEHAIYYVGDTCFKICLPSGQEVKVASGCEIKHIRGRSDRDFHTLCFGRYLYLLPGGELLLTERKLHR